MSVDYNTEKEIIMYQCKDITDTFIEPRFVVNVHVFELPPFLHILWKWIVALPNHTG